MGNINERKKETKNEFAGANTLMHADKAKEQSQLDGGHASLDDTSLTSTRKRRT